MRWPLALICSLILAAAAHAQPRWAEEFSLLEFYGEASDDVLAMVAGDLGQGERLWLGGMFTWCSGLPCTSVIEWNGTTWRNMPGAPSSVFALAMFDDGAGPELYAGSAAGLHRWTGQSWVDLDVAGAVHALTVWDDGRGAALYAGGKFVAAGGAAASNLARWDGDAWEAVGEGTDGRINALAGFDPGDGRLYIGGAFTRAGSAEALNVAAWDGAAFAALGEGLSGVVNALAWYDGHGRPEMFAAGEFSLPARLASWDGSQWAGPYPLSGPAYALARVVVHGRELLAITGGFQQPTVASRGVVLWDGEAPAPTPDFPPQSARCIAMFDSGEGQELHVGGGDGVRDRPAKLESDRWAPLGAGFRNYLSHSVSRVSALTALDGGARPAAAGYPMDAVAWDGRRWAPLGDELSTAHRSRTPSRLSRARRTCSAGTGCPARRTPCCAPAGRAGARCRRSWRHAPGGVSGSAGLGAAATCSCTTMAAANRCSSPRLSNAPAARR